MLYVVIKETQNRISSEKIHKKLYAYNASALIRHQYVAVCRRPTRATRQKSPRNFFRNVSFELFLSDYLRVYHVCVCVPVGRCVRILRAPNLGTTE